MEMSFSKIEEKKTAGFSNFIFLFKNKISLHCVKVYVNFELNKTKTPIKRKFLL